MAKDYLKVEPDKTRIMNKHFTPGRNGRRIRYIVRHHTAGVLTTDQVWNVWQSRAASAHYIVEPNGTIGQLVWDRDTAWANGNSVANQESITIEHSNSRGTDYPISDATIREGARWAAALCLYYNLGRPQFGVNIRDHREFSATSCPYHLARGNKYHNKYMQEAQSFYDTLLARKNGTSPAPKPTPTPTPKPVGTSLDEVKKGFAGDGIDAPLWHFILHADRNSWEANEALKRAEVVVDKLLEEKEEGSKDSSIFKPRSVSTKKNSVFNSAVRTAWL